MAAFAMLAHEVGATQQAQVFGNCRTRDRKGAGDLSGGLTAAAEQVKNSAASGIGEGLEGVLGSLRRRICNRSVTHNT